MKSARLEPGLLQIFRFSLLVQLALLVGNVMVHSRHGLFPGCPGCIIAFGAANILLLVGYLSITGLQKILKHFYLPIALIYATIFSLVLQNILLSVQFTPGDISSEESAWQLFLFLFIPLILIAWQYHFKAVIAYCLLTAFLDHALMNFSHNDFQLVASTYERLLFIRALAFLVTGYVIARIMNQFRQQRAALEQANNELAHYAATLEHLTISRERNRMARELHDTLAHTLSGIAVQLEAIQSLWDDSPAESRAMLTRSLDMTRSGLSETRRALQDLRAEPLEDMALEPALHHLALEAAERAGLKLDWQGGPGLPALSSDVEQGIYRIMQETFENIVRHAAAHCITVKWVIQANELSFLITDDGQGFLIEETPGNQHFGLRGMRERARMMGGTLDVTSQPGHGTSIRLTIRGTYGD